VKTIVKIGFRLIVVISLFFSLFYSCGSGDSCDMAREKCTERGGTPKNCEKESSGCAFHEEDCVCECVLPSTSYKTLKNSVSIETENTRITSVITIEGDEVFFYDDLYFGDVEVGNKQELIISILNNGTTRIIIDELSELHVPFSIVSEHCSYHEIEPFEKCEVVIAFTPSQEGIFSEEFEIHFNDSEDTVISLTIAGDGIK